MGKFGKSLLHEAYSSWHWKHSEGLLKGCWLTDIDRLWVEVRRGQPKVVYDLKREDDNVTSTEKIVYDWFESKGLPVWLLTPTKYDWQSGEIDMWSGWVLKEWKTGEVKRLDVEEFCDILMKLGQAE